MNEKDVFILADEALKSVVDQIRDEQWDSRVPDDMSPRQPGMSLRQIINYHAYDDAWVPDVLAGKTKEEVGTMCDGAVQDTYAQKLHNCIGCPFRAEVEHEEQGRLMQPGDIIMRIRRAN